MVSKISAEDQRDIANLGIVAPELAKIATKMAEKKGENPALDSAGRKFTALATPSGAIDKVTKGITLAKIDAQLQNPQTRAQVETLLQRNPAGFEKVLPQIFEKPEATSALIQQQLALAPAPSAAPATKPPTPSQPAAPAPAAAAGAPTPAIAPRAPASPVAKEGQNSPLAAAAATTPAATPAAPAVAAGAASAPAAPTPGGMAGFLLFLDKQKEKNPEIVKDFSVFTQKMDSNQVPAVSEAYRALTEGQGSSAESNAAFDKLKKTIETEPQFFANMNKMLDKSPGMASTIVSTFNDPKSMVGKMFGNDPGMGMKALAGYSQFANSGIGQMLNGLLESFGVKGGLDGLMQSMLGMMGGKYKASGSERQTVQSNNGGKLTADVNRDTNTAPAKGVLLQDQAGGKQELTAQQLEAKATEKQPQNQTNLEAQQRDLQTAGLQPQRP